MKKQHAPILLAALVPLFLIGFIAAAIVIPKLSAEPPRYDFLFVEQDYNNPWQSYFMYQIQDGRLMINETTGWTTRPMVDPDSEIDLESLTPLPVYRYDVETQTAETISMADAQNLTLDSSMIDPDGYSFSYGYQNYDPFTGIFGGMNEPTFTLKKGSVAYRLDVPFSQNYYNSQFIGWILPQ